MNSLLTESAFFGVMISLFAYSVGAALQKRFHWALLNPLLISVILTIAVLRIGKIDYQTYYEGAEFLGWLLTPATVCLAIPLYEKFALLKRDWKAIGAGITAGVVTSGFCTFLLAVLFRLKHEEYVTLLPRSITAAIGMGLSEELGGYVTLTLSVITVTGILGNIFAELVCRLFGIREPVARGVAIGTAAHVIGTARAMEMGRTEGAISSLALVVAGILTVAGASFMARWI